MFWSSWWPSKSKPAIVTTKLINDADIHRDWRYLENPNDPASLRNADPNNWRRWVVKLQFFKDNDTSPSEGTGFYINLDTNKTAVILTAAHNLISDKGNRVRDLKILRTAADGGDILITNNDDVKICQKYADNPGPKNKVSDYGAILVKFDPKQGGFGFYLNLGLKENDIPGVQVTAHHCDTTPDQPKTYTGEVKRARTECLKYLVPTAQGNSGAPVWVGYEGFETVIAIHNYGGGPKKNDPSQGTRISYKVYRDVCRWAGIGWESKSLKAVPQDKISKIKQPYGLPKWSEDEIKLQEQLGLYLRFSDNFKHGRVRLGTHELDTRFSVLPALTRCGLRDDTNVKAARYVFIREQPPTGKLDFVHWDIEEGKVVTSPEFRNDCLVNLVSKPNKPNGPFEIVRDGQGEQGRYKLRFHADELPPPTSPDLDGLYNLYECSGVTFIREKEKNGSNPFCSFELVAA